MRSEGTKAQRLAQQLADMREDRDQWRAQAERLARAFEKMNAPTLAPTSSVEPRARSANDDDVLYGLKAIAEHFGLTENQAKHRVAQQAIPYFKIGGTVCASRRAIAAWIMAKGETGMSAEQGRH